MAEIKDTLLRQLALLSFIPEQPRFTSTAVLREKLADQGFEVSIRSVQRDLLRLSTMFPLISEEDGSRNTWSYLQGASLDLRAMEPSTALALALAEEHLRTLLPQSVMDILMPNFRKARAYLDGLESNQLANWSRKVRALANGKSLLPAKVKPKVWQAVSNALLEQKTLKVQYHSRYKEEISELILHPAGMVSRHAVSYLIASVGKYNDLRQFALQRITQAELQDQPAKPHKSFNIDRYIQQELNTGSTKTDVTLLAHIAPNIAWLLQETPLSKEQKIQPLEGQAGNAWSLLEVPVPDDTETLWWVFGLGENIRVLQPEHWRRAIKERLQKMAEWY